MDFFKFLRTQPEFLWLVPAFTALGFSYTIDESYRLAASLVYMLFMLIFMRGIKSSMGDSRKQLEETGCDFITRCMSYKQGRMKYFVPCEHEERVARLSAKLFNKQYLRVYVAEFFSDGIERTESFRMVLVNQKQLFEMKLRGMIDTENKERAKQAQEYLGIEWPMP